MPTILRIATRKSPLALWQANHIAAQLLAHWPDLRIELRPMLTTGDRFLSNPLQAIGGKGLFVKELEEGLLRGEADLAVHSMKDVPALLPEGLALTAICKRDNPLDALVAPHYPTLASLPRHAVIGTVSLRRQAQLLAYRNDLVIKPLRGNVQTRLQRLANGEFDAIILAHAGLERLGMQDTITQTLPETLLLPACGQGALGIESRSGDDAVNSLLAVLHDPASAQCVAEERRVNALLGGNCHVPLAVYCREINPDTLLLQAAAFALDGQTVLRADVTGHATPTQQLAQQATQILMDQGALDLLNKAHENP